MKGFIRNQKSKNAILNLFVAFGVATAQNLPNGFRIKSGMTGCVAMFCLSLVPTFAFAEDLLMDEQGPTVPEAIDTITANTDFLTPTYTAPAEQTAPVPSEVDILNEIFGSDTPIPEQNIPTQKPVQHTFTPQTGVQRTDMPLLTPLPPQPIFARADAPIPAPKTYFTQPPYADQALAMASSPASSLSMPREIRITFYKDQTSFSAQALKWVKSLAVRVVNDPRLVAEIRISEETPKIQEKRLSVLLQILKEEGISAHQIRLYKTARDANSILIGYADNPDLTRVSDKNSKKGVQKTINW